MAKSSFLEMIDILESMAQHRKSHPTTKSEELYYDTMAKYYRRIWEAKEEGKPVVGHTVMIPLEIFYAMDIVPMHLECTASMMTILLNKYEEFLGAARGYGLAPETCSGHRILAAGFIQQELPKPDFIVWSNQVCDNTAKSGDALMDLYQIPGFYLDRPYRYTEHEAWYLTKELQNLICFLEDQTGTKMDYDRLQEAVALSQRVIELYRDIYTLRKNRPAPMRNRVLMNQMLMEMFFTGAREGVDYFETVKEDILTRVKNQQGVVEQENYRLLFLFLPPFYEMKIMDWLEREHGAVSVMEPFLSVWPPDFNMNPDKPLESLAQKLFHRCLGRQMHGPAEHVIQDALKAAEDFSPDGAVYFAHIGCRQACALIRTLKDALKKELKVPTLVVDCDIMDPSLTSSEEIRGKFEEFFEMLSDLK
jgi:benzoyl-CoA reductase/2-hydroxyglutaryl-CoA dehydratase subunit BcrC/BadD/HgdB